MISELVAGIENSISGFSRTIYTALAADLATILYVIAALVFVAMMINSITQAKYLGVAAFVGWNIRIVIIVSMASSLTYFGAIMDGVNALPDAISGALGDTGSVFDTLDKLVRKCWEISDASFQDATFGISVTGAIVWLVGVFIGAIGTLLALVAKGGLAVALGLAPIFIASLISSGTSQIFGTWAKSVIGLVLILVLLTTMMSLVATIFADAISKVKAEGSMNEWGAFILVCIISIALMLMIVPLANGMAGSVTSVSSGLLQSAGVAGGLINAMSAASNATKSAYAGGKTLGAMADSAKDGNGMRDSVARAMQARKDIAHKSRNMGSAARQSYAADTYRKSIKAAREAALTKAQD